MPSRRTFEPHTSARRSPRGESDRSLRVQRLLQHGHLTGQRAAAAVNVSGTWTGTFHSGVAGCSSVPVVANLNRATKSPEA